MPSYAKTNSGICPHRSQAGINLAEVMVVVLILGILAAIGVPSYRATILNNRLLAASNDLVTTLNLARSEALKSGERISVCKTSTSTACDTSAPWERGWIVFADAGTAGQIDAGDMVLQVHEALYNGMTVRAEANFADFLSYVGSGRSIGSAGGTAGGWLRLCDPRGAASAARVSVTATGMVSSSQGGESACP
jgi:type IV fimbrial biogenesis protein FimT